VARIVPEEDMPFLPDGRPVDIVLNPLGVPSRMNVGQILETHLGWAARILGFYAKTPVFQGANEREIGLLLKLAGLKWARAALNLSAAPPEVTRESIMRLLENIRPAVSARDESVELLHDARFNDLAGRSMSQETRDLFHGVRDFLSAAAKELADREVAELTHQITVHKDGAENEEFSASRRTEFKAAGRQLEKKAGQEPASMLEEQELSALAGMLGKKSEADVDAAAGELLRLAGMTATGKVWLRDGRSGERFTNAVTVGEIYMLKLSHLVDDKIHARSIGPYSLITQQPLGGKAQFGGQRFGEMEVWALEAYGAAHILQELLTAKSDDVTGRAKIYESIVKGDASFTAGLPESFNVLIRELQSLCLDVELISTKRKPAELTEEVPAEPVLEG
jgi:DNA-directed RNA polymerase subunit beta